MSIKSLFNNKTKVIENATSASAEVESKDYVLERIRRDETFLPYIDFSSASNFAKFGSAEEYYKKSIERIHDDYPYDGSQKEKLQFELSSSYLDKYIFDKRYPKTNGYINFSHGGWGTQSSIADGYGLPASTEYIFLRGGIHAADGMDTKSLRLNFDKSIKYDAEKDRITSLLIDPSEGFTVEFWLKKNSFTTGSTEKEVILDLWNNETSSSSDYGRFTLALSGTTSGEDTFIVTLQSGSSGFYEQSIGTSTVTTSSLSSWHHYALSFVSASSAVTGRLYIDGDLNESKSLGSTGLNAISGRVNGYIGALQTSPSGSSAAAYSGKLSASLDDFRYWKTRRTSKQIYDNWYRHVGGGANTDDANTKLGVYYKFNEGVVGNNSTDSVVLDYSGRLVNGTWTGYSSGARSTDSAFVESGLLTSEEKDPIIYSTHSEVSSLKSTLMASGKIHDDENTSLLYTRIPKWIRDEDPSNDNATKYLVQIMASYFDTLHAQITALPHLKNKVYPSSSYKPVPFARDLLEDKGLITANLFADATVLEMFEDRDVNQVKFEEKITDIKNQIYTNIYNNLEDIFKHKGTEGSVRNMLRCFGIDDEIVKLNIYTDEGVHYFSDAFKHTNVNKKFLDFNIESHNSATVFNETSSLNPVSYISGSGTEKLEQYNAFTSEISIIVPKKATFFDPGYYTTPFLSASVFGMHQSQTSGYTWASPDLANFQVYLVRDELESPNAKFVLKDYDGNINLESDVFKEIYSNEHWNLAVRIKPEDYPIAGNVVTSSNRDYTLEFYGVTHAFDTVKEEFLLTASLNYDTGSAYLSNLKRFYAGAHKINFVGNTLEKTDIKIGKFNFWLDYVDNDTIKLHNKDITSKGTYRSHRSSTIFGKDIEQYEVPSYELAALDWDFETVTTSDGSGEFVILDTTSGSTDSRYGWLDGVTRRRHDGVGYGWPASTTNIVKNEIIYASKKELPEISYSSDGVTIKGEQEEYFIEDEDVSDNFYALEKSMNQVISEEMMRTLSTAQEMSNLMGEAVERYRMNYKKLDNVRRMFFEDVEEDPDFDHFTEYFKFIDSAMSYMVSQLFPVSVRFSKGISDVVESHLFERNKYQNKFPLITTHTATEGSAFGVGQSKYRWEFGHAPLSGDDNDNCLWQKTRAERSDITERETIKDIINNRNNATATTVANENRTTYTRSNYGIRNFSKPVDMKAIVSQTFHPGINYSLQKDRDYVWSAVNKHSDLTSIGVPKNVLIVGAGPGQGIELPVDCNDVEIPNQKKKYNTTVYVGKQAAGAPGGAFSPINDSASYTYAVRGKNKLPFDIFSGSITTGYNSSIVSGYRSDAVVTNLHADTTNFSNDLPLQSPFTQQWVGGHQSRHIDLNRYDTTLIDEETAAAPPNNLDNLHTRAEAWLIKVVESGGSSDGAIGLVDPQYGVTAISGHPNNGNYPDVAKKTATLYRDLRTKRPVNVSNIQTTTSSANHGNYSKTYDIISVAGGVHENNFYFRDNSDQSNYLPQDILTALPETTNYMSLLGKIKHDYGFVFGVGESNVLNTTVETLTDATAASMTFSLQNSDILNDGGLLEITGGATQISAEVTTDETVNVASDIIVEPRRRAFKASGTDIALALNHSYSGLGSSNFSISFWVNNFLSDNSNAGNIKLLTSGGDYLYLFDFNRGASDNSRVLIRTSSLGTAGEAIYATNLSSTYGGQWTHVVLAFDVSDLRSPARLYLNNSEIVPTGYSHNGGAAGTIARLEINLDDEYGAQDIVVWDKVLSPSEISELYNSGDWFNPEDHSADANIVDWYQMGEEDYWHNLGYKFNDVLSDIGGSITRYISSSYGSGANDLSISSAYDQEFLFTAGIGERGSTEMFNRLSSSLSSSFPDFQVSYTTSLSKATFTLNAYSAGALDVDLTETNLGFGNLEAIDGTDVVLETGYLNTTTIATESVTRTVISSRFSAPGSIDTLTYGFLDAYSQEYSAYNSLNYRNLTVRGSGSGESGTIRLDDHLENRHGLKTHLRRHSGKFGSDSVYGSVPEATYVTSPSFFKQQRNENRRPSDTSTVLSPVLVTRHDNMHINSPIPRSDFQYKWVTSSIGSNYSITSGKQRMYGYAHPSGIMSSSAVIDGDSGFVPAITFPTASEIFGV